MNAPTWEAAGAKDAVERAADRVKSILAAPVQRFLSDEQSREVKRLLVRAEAELEELDLHI